MPSLGKNFQNSQPTNLILRMAQTLLMPQKRLFGHNDEDIKVTLFRDYHAWCPYCQKIWLWLEWKKIPYLVKKASMRCYGQKEEWYLKKSPIGDISSNRNKSKGCHRK